MNGNIKLHKPADSNASEYSFKHVQNQDPRSNSDISTDPFKNMENKELLMTVNMVTSRPEDLMEATKDARTPISEDLEHHDEFHEVKTLSAKQIAHKEENKDELHIKDRQRDHSQDTCLTGANAEKTVSGDCCMQKDNEEV